MSVKVNVCNFDTKYTRDTKADEFNFDKNIYNKDMPKYHLEIDDYGHQKLVEDAEPDNWYEKIQSYHDGCALKKLLERYKETGDISILDRRKGDYFDATSMPKSLLEMYKKVQEGENYFNSLPNEYRELFNFSYGEFLAKGGVIENANVVNDKFNSISNTDSVNKSKVESEVDNNDKQ